MMWQLALTFIVGVIVGLFLGASLGVLLMCLLQMAGRKPPSARR